MTRIATSFALLSLMACGTEAVDSDVFGPADYDPMLGMERGDAVRGNLVMDDDSVVRFRSQQTPKGLQVRVELNGMALTANYDGRVAAFDGVNMEDGTPAFITHEDRADLVRLTAALESELYPSIEGVTTKEEYDALRGMTDAESRLFSSIEGIWAQWPSSSPLDMEFKMEAAQHYSWNRWTNDVGYRTDHDCWDCERGDSDCQDYKALGRYFDGDNHANCGISSSGSQFTHDCGDHDQCVRTSKHGGHSIASAWCNDHLSGDGWAAADEISAPSCQYDWRGSSNENNCAHYLNKNDGCDCFCGGIDTDCAT